PTRRALVFGRAEEPANAFPPILELPRFRMLLLIGPLDEVAGRLHRHLHPRSSTEAQVPADGDLGRALERLRKLRLRQDLGPLGKVNDFHGAALRFLWRNKEGPIFGLSGLPPFPSLPMVSSLTVGVQENKVATMEKARFIRFSESEESER